MSNHPYKPLTTSQSQTPSRLRGVISYLVTSLVIGSLSGVMAISCYLIFIVAPFWGPLMYRGDERIYTVFFVASTLLPIFAIAGVAFALIGFRFTSFRLRHQGVVISCITLWLLITVNRPMVARAHRPDLPAPKYESVPDTMSTMVLVLLIVTFMSRLREWMAERNRDSTPNGAIKND